MRATLERYLLKSWLLPLLGALLFYGGLIMAYEVVGVSKQIFAIGAPFRWVLPLLLLVVPENLSMVLPMACALGGLMGTQHLAEGSETVAAQGLGVGMRNLVRPWAILAAGLLILASLNAHILVPWSNATQLASRSRMLDEARTRFLRPGAPPWFPPAAPGDAVWMDADGQVHLMGVTPDHAQHLVAQSLVWTKADSGLEDSVVTLQLNDISGAVYQRSEGTVLRLNEREHAYSIPVPSQPKLLAPTRARFLTSRELMRAGNPEAQVELCRRFTLPLAAMALLLVGIALGLGHPRFQKGGAILKSLAVILVYFVLIKYFESQILGSDVGSPSALLWLYALPWIWLAAGFGLLAARMRPHQANRFRKIRDLSHLGSIAPQTAKALGWGLTRWRDAVSGLKALRQRMMPTRQHGPRTGVLADWSRGLWWRNWGAVLGTLLALDFLIEFASLAGDLAHNGQSIGVFLRYWGWKLPPYLSVVLPLAFLLGGVLALSDAAVSREWVALRAGGTSLVQWGRTAWRAWALVLAGTFAMQAFLGPVAHGQARDLYQKILGRPARVAKTRPWLNLGATGVVWYLDGKERFGFPLKPPGVAPVLLTWRSGEPRAQALPWGALALAEGPEAADLFPARALRDAQSAEEASTLDLVQWQRWAPDPERATLFWTRLLNWLAGPVLLFAMLPFAFPSPRSGRGASLGLCLVAGLVFLGLQAVFQGAAKSGDLPAAWGVLCPMLLMLGFGLVKLERLRT